MGRPQYSDPSDEAVAIIETSVEEIQVLVNEIKDTDLANIEEKVYSPLRYNSFEYSYFNLSFPTNQWVEMLKIDGEGYIESALYLMDNVFNDTSYFRVKVDGVFVWNSYFRTDAVERGWLSGFSSINSIVGSINSANEKEFTLPFIEDSLGKMSVDTKIQNMHIGELPSSSLSGVPRVVLVSNKIEFKSQLLIECQVPVAVNADVKALFRGGTKKI